MGDTSLLSDMCTICHSPPKYRCPRCSARTCSLPCSQRHKQWAQCSGTRDPAVYLRRSELATPKSFDRDFNFISGIERKIESAERDATSRGVLLHDARTTGRRDGPVKGEVQFQRALENCGVVVEKAPVGMSRNLQNKTAWNKNQNCIAWTVEWILDEGNAKLGVSLGKDPISESYRKQFDRPVRPFKKRKIGKGSQGSTSSTGSLTTRATNINANSGDSPSVDNVHPDSLPASTDAEATDQAVHDHSQDSDPLPRVSDHQSLTADSADSAEVRPLEPTAAPHYFYLHITRPVTPSSKVSLLPVSPSSALTSILRNRIIREFPTVYVFSHELQDSHDAKFAIQADHTSQVSDMIEGVLDSDRKVADNASSVSEENKDEDETTSSLAHATDEEAPRKINQEPDHDTSTGIARAPGENSEEASREVKQEHDHDTNSAAAYATGENSEEASREVKQE